MADCFLFQPLFIFCSITFPFRGSFRACFITPNLQVCSGEKTSFGQNYFARWWKFGWASQRWEWSVLRGQVGPSQLRADPTSQVRPHLLLPLALLAMLLLPGGSLQEIN